MSWWLHDLISDLAVARGGKSADADSNSRFLRRRIASAAWLLGAGLVWLLALWLQSWIVAVVGIAVLLVGLWLFAERADQVSSYVKRRLHKG